MPSDLFSPKRPDGRAEWRVIYDATQDLAYGAEITFEEIAKLLGSDDRDRAYRAVGRCNHEYLREGTPRMLGSVQRVGYRVLRPAEYPHHALAHRQRAVREIETAVDVMRAAPVDDMTPGQRDWAHKVTMVLIDNQLRLRSHEDRLQHAETRLAELERRTGIITQGTVIPGARHDAGS